jgi:predicted N-acetyltransferase YhbS
MPDMLVRLYDLPDSAPVRARCKAAGLKLRRIEPMDRARLLEFVRREFTDVWASEVEMAFARHPITGFVVVDAGEIGGFAVYECTRRGFFGPTGVREDLRRKGAGAALLFACLESMREMGYAYAIIGGVGPAAFYERACGARVIEGSERGIYGDLLDERQARRDRRG